MVQDALYAWFAGPKYNGSGAMLGLDAEDAEHIDEILRRWWPIGTPVTVDRARLSESVEAWVHVVVHERPRLLAGFGPYPRPAVLTWQNSD